jgi:WD40 repeat protein
MNNIKPIKLICMRTSSIYIIICLLLYSLQTAQIYAQTYKPLRTLVGTGAQMQNIRFSPNGKVLACGDTNGQIFIWDVNTGKTIRTINAHSSRINEVTFNSTGDLLVSASYDGSARVWDMNTGELKGIYYNKDLVSGGLGSRLISFACFSADSRFIFFGGDGGALMRAKLGKDSFGNNSVAAPFYTLISINAHGLKSTSRITGGVISHDGRNIVISYKNEVLSIDVTTAMLSKRFSYPVYLNDVVVGASASQITTWSEDGYVTIWDYASTRIVKKIKAGDVNDYSAASYNASGSLMATGASGVNANVWDVERGTHLGTLSGHNHVVRVARFSPVANLIATASQDGTVKIWKVEEPEPVKPETATVLKDTVYIEKPVKVIVRDTVYITKRDTVYIEKPIPKESADKIDESKLEIGKTFNLKHLQFEQGDHTLLPSSSEQLQEVIALLQKYPRMVIQLEGHTDNQGEPKKNMSLSQRRVATVKNYLIEFGGIDENRIKVKAFGQDSPIASNSTEETRKLNRRVEMRILEL